MLSYLFACTTNPIVFLARVNIFYPWTHQGSTRATTFICLTFGNNNGNIFGTWWTNQSLYQRFFTVIRCPYTYFPIHVIIKKQKHKLTAESCSLHRFFTVIRWSYTDFSMLYSDPTQIFYCYAVTLHRFFYCYIDLGRWWWLNKYDDWTDMAWIKDVDDDWTDMAWIFDWDVEDS